jgi:hypothetical protein
MRLSAFAAKRCGAKMSRNRLEIFPNLLFVAVNQHFWHSLCK